MTVGCFRGGCSPVSVAGEVGTCWPWRTPVLRGGTSSCRVRPASRGTDPPPGVACSPPANQTQSQKCRLWCTRLGPMPTRRPAASHLMLVLLEAQRAPQHVDLRRRHDDDGDEEGGQHAGEHEAVVQPPLEHLHRAARAAPVHRVEEQHAPHRKQGHRQHPWKDRGCVTHSHWAQLKMTRIYSGTTFATKHKARYYLTGKELSTHSRTRTPHSLQYTCPLHTRTHTHTHTRMPHADLTPHVTATPSSHTCRSDSTYAPHSHTLFTWNWPSMTTSTMMATRALIFFATYLLQQ